MEDTLNPRRLENIDQSDMPYHSRRIDSLIRVLASDGIIASESGDAPIFVKCQGLWKHPEVEEALSRYNATYNKKWGVDKKDSLTIRPLNTSEFTNEEFLEDLKVLVPYLAEQFHK